MKSPKAVLAAALERCGCEMRALDRPSPGFRRGLKNLSRVSAAASVIDCGVADGTHVLYAAFPARNFLLIEADPIHKSTVERLAAKLGARHELVFCGPAPGQQTIHVYEDPHKAVCSRGILRSQIARSPRCHAWSVAARVVSPSSPGKRRVSGAIRDRR